MIKGGKTMYDISGLITQFGFEFQKKVFIDFLLKEMDIGVQVKYEFLDDVTFCNDSLNGTTIHENLIQCKTGNISYSTFKHVFCNWIALDLQSKYILISEKKLNFTYDLRKLRKDIYNDILNYKITSKSNKRSILYKVKKKYNGFSSLLDVKNFLKHIKTIYDNFFIDIANIVDIEMQTKERFFQLYCQDISIEYAKKSRFEMFDSFITTELNKAIAHKEPFVIDQVFYGKIINETIKSIDDEKYNYNFYEFKESKYNIFKSLENSREALFLKKITISEEQVARYLTEELYYKNLREHYNGIGKKLSIDGVEETANLNYLVEKSRHADFKDVFFNTIEKEIDSTILLNAYYKHGCYIYLSSDDSENNYFIDWCGENAK